MRRADGAFSMISAEMWTDPHWVAMRLGVWKSTDALHWVKQRTLRQSTGKFDGGPHSATCAYAPPPPASPGPSQLPTPAAQGPLTHSIARRRRRSGGPFFLHDPANDTWALSYVAYRSSPGNASGWLENVRAAAPFASSFESLKEARLHTVRRHDLHTICDGNG